jgi:hypothetical protein
VAHILLFPEQQSEEKPNFDEFHCDTQSIKKALALMLG